jgi:hypothetical protein
MQCARSRQEAQTINKLLHKTLLKKHPTIIQVECLNCNCRQPDKSVLKCQMKHST